MSVFRIGVDDFKELIDDNGYFVDKSLLIREVIDGNKVTLFPRPRRFGKTLNMTMLRYFFEHSNEDRRYIFEDLTISNHPDCLKHQGQYPVVFISLKDVKGASWDEMKKRLIEKSGDPAIATSASILFVATLGIALIASLSTASEVSLLLGRGALVSFALIMGFYPSLLLLLDSLQNRRKK